MSTAPSPARSPAPDFVPLPEEFDDDADLDLDANHVEEAPPAYLGPQSRSTSDPRRRSPHRSQSNENNEHGKEKRRRTMHKFDLKKDDKSWLVLRLASLAPSSKSTPVYIGNKPIRGVVELNLDKPQHLISVDVTIKGRFWRWLVPGRLPNKNDLEVFLNISQNLWKAPETKKPSFVGRFTHKEGTEVEGNHKWDFSIQLPDTVIIPGGEGVEDQECHLPASIQDHSCSASIIYELAVTVKRGTIGSPTILSSHFQYSPLTRPPAFAPLRQSVYDLGFGQLIGPHDDPSGWVDTETVRIKGRIFNKRDVTVSCTLSLAKPLQYTRGSFIPCCLTLESTDKHALELLSIPSAPVVDLISYVELRHIKRHTRKFSLGDGGDSGSHSSKAETETSSIQSAKWWVEPSPTHAHAQSHRSNDHRRRLYGEIHLRSNLTPQFDTPDMKLSYKVCLLPFSTPGFVQAEQAPVDIHVEALRSQAIDIVTGYAPVRGSVPIPVTPASYKKTKRRPNPGLEAAFLASGFAG